MLYERSSARLRKFAAPTSPNMPVEQRHRWKPGEHAILLQYAKDYASPQEAADAIYAAGILPGISARQILPQLQQLRDRGFCPWWGPAKQVPMTDRASKALGTIGELMKARGVTTIMVNLIQTENGEAVEIEGFAEPMSFLLGR